MTKESEGSYLHLARVRVVDQGLSDGFGLPGRGLKALLGGMTIDPVRPQDMWGNCKQLPHMRAVAIAQQENSG